MFGLPSAMNVPRQSKVMTARMLSPRSIILEAVIDAFPAADDGSPGGSDRKLTLRHNHSRSWRIIGPRFLPFPKNEPITETAGKHRPNNRDRQLVRAPGRAGADLHQSTPIPCVSRSSALGPRFDVCRRTRNA